MSNTLAYIVFLVPLAVIIAYYDVRYRRIPNPFVLATLAGGVVMNSIFGGLQGVYSSLAGCGLAFVLMFMIHVFGAMGAGDVKLLPRGRGMSAARGCRRSWSRATGGLLAIIHLRAGTRSVYDSASADIVACPAGRCRGCLREQQIHNLTALPSPRPHYFYSNLSR